jgi:hypothetical protein
VTPEETRQREEALDAAHMDVDEALRLVRKANQVAAIQGDVGLVRFTNALIRARKVGRAVDLLRTRVARMAATRPAETSREFYQLDGLREALRIIEEEL